jgi:hypothetical protein
MVCVVPGPLFGSAMCGNSTMNKKILNKTFIILLLATFHGSLVYPGTDPVIERCNELLKLNKSFIKIDLEMIDKGEAIWYGLNTDNPGYYYAVRDYLANGEYVSYLANDFDNDDVDEVALACKDKTDYYVVIFKTVRNKWYQYVDKIKVRGMFYLSNDKRIHDIKVCYYPDTDDFDLISWDGKKYTILAAQQGK